MGMKCPKCHFDNPSDSKFYKECGTQLLPHEEISVSVTRTLQKPASGLQIGSILAARYQTEILGGVFPTMNTSKIWYSGGK